MSAATAFAQDKFFDSAGVQIRYMEKGAGEPVVLLHGYAGIIERTWVDSGVMDDLDMVVIEGAPHTGERGVLRRPEFVQAVRTFLAAQRASAVAGKK